MLFKFQIIGSNVAGDVKYKIFNFIREWQVDMYKVVSDATHAIFSDIPDIVLHILASHEPNFYLLKEKDTVYPRRRPAFNSLEPSNEEFYVLHLG